MFWVAFYGCLLAEVIPVPIEVPLSRQVHLLLLGGFLCVVITEKCYIKFNKWPCMDWLLRKQALMSLGTTFVAALLLNYSIVSCNWLSILFSSYVFQNCVYGVNNTGLPLCVTNLMTLVSFRRMLVVSRLASCWAAVVLVLRWPVKFASKGSPRHQMERSSSSKVSQTKHTITVLLLTQQESVSVSLGASRPIILNILYDVQWQM